MTLARVVADLAWPDERCIMAPSGAGPAVHAALARKKIGQYLPGLEGQPSPQVGVLSPDPDANSTDAPLALVCAFDRPVPETTIAEIHRRAWNFSRTPLLLTVDTRSVRAFSCCEPPTPHLASLEIRSELTEVAYRFTEEGSRSTDLIHQATHSLHWLELVSGRLLRWHERRFPSSNRADVLLLSNLRYVREALHDEGLDYDVIHDLLARIMFVQFLFDRRDSDGQTALNPNYLSRLNRNNILSESYRTFSEILSNHEDCYRLFWYLDDHFNGDLFPGRSGKNEDRTAARRAEQSIVQSSHLDILSSFVSGNMELKTGQLSLWPHYSFDIIPLEFISSIYEAFVTKKRGTVYTPAHLVDFVLDGVLPWRGTDWNLKVLDPACGSGIFLVKAYQRLIHRWKCAHPRQRIGSAVLRSLLERNLVGVDIDQHAVRTASFSLYLAMCDEIDPRHYWTQVKFPSLRGRSLLAQDFFHEGSDGIQTVKNESSYDVIVGNAPWGQNSDTALSRAWARERKWPVSYGDIGPLFLAKSASLAKADGRISLLQPASTILFNHSTNARRTRGKIFDDFTVTELVNLSALRFGLFRNAVGPAILITLIPEPSKEQSFQYICPKPVRYSGSDDYRITIDQYDVHELLPHEVLVSPIIWSALIWGGRRDVALLERLSSHKTINKLRGSRGLAVRQGLIRGKDQVRRPEILGKRILDSDDFPSGVLLHLSPSALRINDDPYTHERDSTNFAAFEPVQLIVKMSWTKEDGRFRAVLVTPSNEAVLCTRKYMSVRAAEDAREILEEACLSYNSSVALYYLFLCSGRFANYRPEPYMSELLDVPLPAGAAAVLGEVASLEDLDNIVMDLLGIRPSERVLIEDALMYALADFKGDGDSPGRAPTCRNGMSGAPSLLHLYCRWFLRVMRAGFGTAKDVCATVYVEGTRERLPLRLVAFHLGFQREVDVMDETIGAGQLAQQLRRIHGMLASDDGSEIGYRRIARIFDVWEMDGKRVPTILMVKPDESRYWTQSVAMRDADEVSREILSQRQYDSHADWRREE